MGCPNLDGKVGQDCGEGPQSSAAHGPWPRHPGCPLGGVPVLRAGLCARGISSSPPWGRSIQGQGPSPGHPALTSAPPPAPAHPQTHAATQPPTHSPSCPVPPRPQARIWGPRTRCGPCPLGPCSRGVGGTGLAVTAVWLIDFWPHQPGPGRGGAGPRMGHLGPRASGGPWGGPARVRGVQAHAAAPRASCLLPTLPGAVHSACPQAAWSLLRLQEAAAFLRILALPNLCAAATESIFFKNRMDVRKTTIPQNHTQGVDRAGSLALNNRAATSLMGNKNKQPTQGTRAGEFHTQQPPVGTWVPGPRRQECGRPGGDCLPPQPLPGTHPGKGHLEVVPPVGMEEVRPPSPSQGQDPLW